MILELKDLSKVYKKKTALERLNLHIEKGDCIVLCGGNGAGKSTMIKMLTGVESPTTGSVAFHSKQQKPFAYMPDQMIFPSELTPYEILDYYRQFLNKNKESVKWVLEKTGLWSERNQKAGGFSKGMSQRLNLAQCMLADTDIYILDEPTDGLDPYWVIQLKKIIKELKEENKTIIVSSHIMRDAIEIADKLIILFNGKIKFFGTLNQVYKEYRCISLEEVFLSIHKNEQQTG
ncbi:ABC-2 type transport system ATP-binding protein [Cytobacillus firmus]|uniref:ABC-2 type transport system ATP-binding protein n=2 Tax=Cytobacillus TaxID=2675230 RepID=A0A366K5D4_CYTFI|nr:MULTISPECIES: ABC transporter ATP-binding protein [Cytobacillus]RBP96497.1 ABC-2 type transport system ATP-binding protein [Cytobacillus firmus]TDX45776.1 ABC-2 type transport system ATP-binding protein [Cytobacillus oceanisediminis]